MITSRTQIALHCLVGLLAVLAGSNLLQLERADAQSVTARAIQSALLPLIDSHRGEVAVSVRILDEAGKTTLQWQYREDVPMPTASLIKLPVMIEAYRQADAGELSLDDEVVLTEEDKVPGSGILTDHFSAGASFPLRDAIRLMMRYSDNTATNLVLDRIGLDATAKLMSQMGMPETQIHSKVYRGDTSIAPERSKTFGLGSSTADNMTELLSLLEQRSVISEDASNAMLEHLRSCDDALKLPRFLPSDCEVAHKTGSVNRSRTAAGIISSSRGKFAICVLTNENQDASWGDNNAADVLIGKIAKAVDDLLSAATSNSSESGPREALSQGANGPLVEALQRTLNDRMDSTLVVDGSFGPVTVAAVKEFQKSKNLAENGQVDSATWRALGVLITEDKPQPPPAVVNAEQLERSVALDPLAPPSVSAAAWVIVDAATGEMTGGSEMNKQLPNASTTKLMTAYLVLELAQGDAEVLNETITFSARADATIGSTCRVRAGEQLSVGELLYGLMLPSGNDAAVALAEHFGERLAAAQARGPAAGSSSPAASTAEEMFVEAMNAKAKELGMTNTRFANPHGLTAPEHFSSAADLALLTRLALQLPGLPEIVNCRQRGCQLTSVDGYTRNIVWRNTNRLLRQEGFSGVKTGTTKAAGACLIASGSRDGKETIAVVLGSSSSNARYIDARNLFAWAWRQ